MKFHVIDAGRFKLDGGAMFGVVPKVIWNKLNPADENNMCTWALRCLLVEYEDRKILVDTGMGNKQDERFRSHFHPHGNTDLISSLAEKGFSPEDITDVFITHMHFDHVGGAVKFDEIGNLVPTFPNAKYWSNKKHYDWAFSPNMREKASFLHENFVPLKEGGVLELLDDYERYKWMDKISIGFYYGHTEAMMVPEFEMDNGKKLIYMADLMPSTAHVRLPYVMSYDIRPLDTLQERKSFYERAIDENSYLFLEHDPFNEVFTIAKDSKGRYGVGDILRLDEIR
ncbi:MAG TPA: MBL fold metallo-hydrolase [Saprospiraceae bacterium]|nr:MBL fold metallo-hydrolase [Saprospiraceae bacterium]